MPARLVLSRDRCAPRVLSDRSRAHDTGERARDTREGAWPLSAAVCVYVRGRRARDGTN